MEAVDQGAPAGHAAQINDDDLTRWAKQLRLKIRNFAIRHFEGGGYQRVDYQAVEELRETRLYHLMEGTTPGTRDFEAFLSSSTRRTTVIQAFMWHFLNFEVFKTFLWAGAASRCVQRVHCQFEQGKHLSSVAPAILA